jgi:hypothetical protein
MHLKFLQAFAMDGVPGEGTHHLLYLLDQIHGFVARLCNDPYFRFAPHKIAKRVAIK